MGCQSDVVLGRNLTFTICTHDPDTGELTDADAVPNYRVYEGETTAAILTGTMAKLDDANTTGFYSEQVAVTTANGFEVHKSYNIYIEATVDSDTGGISFGFLVSSAATATSSTSTDTNELTARRGDTYNSDNDDPIINLGNIAGRTKLWIAVKMSTSQTDAQATLFVEETDGLTRVNGSAYGTAAHSSITVSDAANGNLTWVIDEAVMDDMRVRSYPYDIQVLNDGNVTTLRTGTFTVPSDVVRAIT